MRFRILITIALACSFVTTSVHAQQKPAPPFPQMPAEEIQAADTDSSIVTYSNTTEVITRPLTIIPFEAFAYHFVHADWYFNQHGMHSSDKEVDVIFSEYNKDSNGFAELNGLLNDSGVSGVEFEYHGPAGTTEDYVSYFGQEFLVVFDPAWVPGTNQTRVESTNFMHVRATLQGISPWIGTGFEVTPQQTGVVLHSTGMNAIGSNDCCSRNINLEIPGSTGTSCGIVPNSPMCDPGKPDCMLLAPLATPTIPNFGAGFNFRSGPFIDRNRPFTSQFGGWDAGYNRVNDQPIRPHYTLPSFDNFPVGVSPIPLPIPEIQETCETCERILPGDCFDMAMPDTHPLIGEDSCSPTKNGIDPLCTRISGGMGTIPPQCGGFGVGDYVNTAGCFGPTSSGISGKLTSGLGGGSLAVNKCGGYPVPEYCKYVSGEAPECFEGEAQSKANEFWVEHVLGCGRGNPADGVTCFDGGACYELTTGVVKCIHCNDDGHCRESIQRNGGFNADPRVVDGEEEIAEEIEACQNIIDEGGICTIFIVDLATNPTGGQENESGVTPSDLPSSNDARRTALDEEEEPPAPPKEEPPKKEPDNKPLKEGDPVLLATGGLSDQTIDIKYDGSELPLMFVRNYDSKSDYRGIIGSNWSFEYDERVVPITEANAPEWLSSYCTENLISPNCVFYEKGVNGRSIYYRDRGHASQTIYTPQAGNTGTLVSTKSGWMHRTHDGTVRTFGSYGYLESIENRLGDRIEIEYEYTPLGSLFHSLCNANVRETVEQQSGYDGRFCDWLAYTQGKIAELDVADEGISATKTVNGETVPEISTPDFPCVPTSLWGNNYCIFPVLSNGFQNNLRYAELLRMIHILPESPVGTHMKRPTTMSDHHGRSLTFEYHQNIVEDLSTNKRDVLLYGMLKAVEGTGGIRVELHYDRPLTSSYPARLADLFLTKVSRNDSAPNGNTTRELEYKYPWSDGQAATGEFWPTASYNTLQDSYMKYYSSVNGCTVSPTYAGAIAQHLPNDACSNGLPAAGGASGSQGGLLPGNPCLKTQRKSQTYLSDIADNIVKIVDTGIVALENEFIDDFFDRDFDKVSAQRYGGTYVESPSGNWVTGFPLHTFEYFEGDDGALLSDPDLSALLTDIVAEVPVSSPGCETSTDPDCLNGLEIYETPITTAPSCDASTFAHKPVLCTLKGSGAHWQALPGAPEKAYEPRDVSYSDQISITDYPCGTIAAAYVGNPSHNGLVASISKVDSSIHGNGITPQYNAQYDQSKRLQLEQDVNRICEWVRTVNRDGVELVHGLNFRGQSLFMAKKHFSEDGGEYVGARTMYNADGNVIFETLPYSATEYHGHKTHAYDNQIGSHTVNFSVPSDSDPSQDIDKVYTFLPHAVSPGYWTRRDNMVESATHYAMPSTLEVAPGYTLDFESTLSQYRHEPLFNQVKSVEKFVVSVEGALVPTYHEELIFDYQELEVLPASGTVLTPLSYMLLDLVGWGWEFSQKAYYASSTFVGIGLSSDYHYIMGLGVERFESNYLSQQQFKIDSNLGDVNSDGRLGSGDKIRGVPIERTVFPVAQFGGGLPQDSPRVTTYEWSSYGRLLRETRPSQQVVQHRYYPLGQFVSGAGSNPPSVQSFESPLDSRGLLGRSRVDVWGDADFGQTLSAGLESRRCGSLDGPLQFILPGGCSSGNGIATLDNLGVHNDALAAISTNAGQSRVVSFGYSQFGDITHRWSPEGLTLTAYNGDRYPFHIEHPNGVVEQITYAFNGSEIGRLRHKDGSILSLTKRLVNLYGDVLLEGNARTSGGCDAIFASTGRITVDTSDSMVGLYAEPSCQLSRNEYSGERNLLFHESQGLQTTYDYDALGRTTRTEEAFVSAYNGRVSGRVNLKEYDLFGRVLIDNTSGYDNTNQTVIYDYDSFGNLITHQDRRGNIWAQQPTFLGAVAYKEFLSSIYQSAGVMSDRTDFKYNGFGEVASETYNGLLTTEYFRLHDGRTYGVRRTGESDKWFTSDYNGQVIWSSKDPTHSQLVLLNAARDKRYSLNLEWPTEVVTSGHAPLAITSISDLDIYGNDLGGMRVNAEGDVRAYSLTRDGLGRRTSYIDELGREFSRNVNLLGQTIESCSYDMYSYATACALFEYDDYDYLSEMLDPQGSATQVVTDPFGRKLGMVAQVESPVDGGAPYEWSVYDDLDRLTHRQERSGEYVQLNYTAAGDVYSMENSEGLLREFTHDAFGRVVTALSESPIDSHYEGGDMAWENPLLGTEDYSVYRDYTYDLLGNVIGESLQVGGEFYTATHTYSYLPNSFSVVSGLDGEFELFRNFDGRGREIEVESERLSASVGTYTQVDWIGDEVLAKAADNEFKELRELNGFGQMILKEYLAIELSGGAPVSPSLADDYCGEHDGYYGWDPDYCELPILALDINYFANGLIDDSFTFYGFPNGHIRDGSDLSYYDFTYDGRQQLVDFSLYGQSMLSGGFGAGGMLVRDPDVGSVLQRGSSAGPVTTSRWAHGMITQLQSNEASGPVTHDSSGRIIELPLPELFHVSYDSLGQLVSTGYHKEVHIYDANGQLTANVSSDGSAVHHVRMSNGLYVQHRVDQGQMDFLVKGSKQNTFHAMIRDDDSVLIPLTDERRSIIGVWDLYEMEMVEYRQYDVNGRVRVVNAYDQVICSEFDDITIVCPETAFGGFGFTGAWKSSSSGLQHFSARWYSSALGEFMSPDPLWYVDAYDPYAYAGFDPVNFWDPLGLDRERHWNQIPTEDPWDWIDTAALAAGFVPGVGTAMAIGEVATGRDIRGRPVNRVASAVGLVPGAKGIVSGGRAVLRGGRALLRTSLVRNAGRRLCFVAGTQVVVFEATANIESIDVGDVVIGYVEMSSEDWVVVESTKKEGIIESETEVNEVDVGGFLSFEDFVVMGWSRFLEYMNYNLSLEAEL